MEDKDLTIDELLAKVETQRKAIHVPQNYTLQTNMSLCFEFVKRGDATYNIHALDENTLVLFLDRIETLMTNIPNTCRKHDIDVVYVLHGFTLEQWRDDILYTLRKRISQRKLASFKLIEDRLNNLMSKEKKEMIEIMGIMKMLS